MGFSRFLSIVSFCGVYVFGGFVASNAFANPTMFPVMANIAVLNKAALSCPANFIKVPGSPEFCIAKYEMRNNGSGTAVSQSASAPWSAINQPTARTKCQALGAGYDLPTIAQWQT